VLVCHCHEVGDRTLRKCIRDGARTVAEIGAACGAGTSCGGCRPVLEELVSALVLPRFIERFECGEQSLEQNASAGATP
jgi:bacterioferritin-associated ferredoxin